MTYHLILRINNTAGVTVEAGTYQSSPGLGWVSVAESIDCLSRVL